MLTVAVFGIICTLAAGYFMKLAYQPGQTEEPARERRTLPMAVSEIAPGTVITRAHLGNGPWDRSLPLEPDTLVNIDSIVGRITREKITAAQPLRGAMFYPIGDFPEIDVAEDKRAVVVQVSPTTAVLNSKLKPGQFVDVQLTVQNLNVSPNIQPQASNVARNSVTMSDAMTATLFKGVRVVSINKGGTSTTLQNAQANANSVTLELDEEQSRIALLAQKRGDIDLIYSKAGPGEGGIDIDSSEEDRIFFLEILGLRSPSLKQPFRSEHYRGSGFSDAYFEDGVRTDEEGSRQQQPLFPADDQTPTPSESQRSSPGSTQATPAQPAA
jgi:pilus assembly protein CpaB